MAESSVFPFRADLKAFTCYQIQGRALVQVYSLRVRCRDGGEGGLRICTALHIW